MERRTERIRQRAGRPWLAAIAFGCALVVLTGCSPKNQGEVFRDGDSGQPALFVALCSGEQIEAAELTVSGAPDGYGVLWRVERRSDDHTVDQVVLGEVPAGFQEVVPLEDPELPRRDLEFTAELRGGGVTEAGETFLDSSLSARSAEDTAVLRQVLREAAADNCSLRPASLPAELNLVAPLFLAAAMYGALRLRTSHHLAARVGRMSPWRWSFGFAVIGAALLLLPWESGTRNEPLRFLGIGATLGLVLVGCAAIGQKLRRAERGGAKRIEPLLVMLVGSCFVVPATVFAGTVEGGLVDCGDGWSFDCSPTWLERVILLAPLVLAWITAVLVGEGGWWPTDRLRPEPATRPEGRPPVRRAIALGVLLLIGLVATLDDGGSADQPTPGLVTATYICDVDLIDELLAAGADPNTGGPVDASLDRYRPLEIAAEYCSAPAIEALLDAGASTELPADDPPLHAAVEAGNGAAVDVLLRSGADPSWADGARTLVWTASDDGKADIVASLVDAGASVSDSDETYSHSPLFRAVMGGHADVAEELLDAGADPNWPGDLRWYDIGLFVYSLDEDEQGRLVEQLGPALGLDPTVIEQFTPGGIDEAATMLDVVADTSESVGSFPPLYLAAAQGDAGMVAVLLAGGADPTIGTGPTGHLPIEAAEALGYEDVVELLESV